MFYSPWVGDVGAGNDHALIPHKLRHDGGVQVHDGGVEDAGQVGPLQGGAVLEGQRHGGVVGGVQGGDVGHKVESLAGHGGGDIQHAAEEGDVGLRDGEVVSELGLGAIEGSGGADLTDHVLT